MAWARTPHEGRHPRRWPRHPPRRGDPPQAQADGADRRPTVPLAPYEALLRAWRERLRDLRLEGTVGSIQLICTASLTHSMPGCRGLRDIRIIFLTHYDILSADISE